MRFFSRKSKDVEARRMQIQSLQSSRRAELEASWKERIASLETAAAPPPLPSALLPLPLPLPLPPQAAGHEDRSSEAHLRGRAWSAIVSALAAFAVISETLRCVDEARRRSCSE